MFLWKRRMPWLVIAAEQVCVAAAGSSDALLENRDWAATWGLTPGRLRRELEKLFPGVGEYLDAQTCDQDTPWPKNLLNRVYKMYYSGTSARGGKHDPSTRAAESEEHWRRWKLDETRWSLDVLLYIVGKGKVCCCWRAWL
jgi:hypothetical protein